MTGFKPGMCGYTVSGASDRIQGLIQAHKQLQNPWLLVCSSTPPQSYSKACTLQQRPVTIVRLARPAVCKCAGSWASPKCTHGGGVSVRGLDWHLTLVQQQRPGLAAGAISRLFLQPGGFRRKRPRQQVSANANT